MLNRLLKVLSTPSTSANTHLMTHYILNVLERKKYATEVDLAGNILITKGKAEIYPCVTAHLDTVHGWDIIDIIEKDGILSSAKGIGGDDKCGIFICLELLNTLPALKVAFFQGEEIGCVGSKAVDLQFFTNVGYIIGIDRRGNSDFIATLNSKKTISKPFKKATRQMRDKYKYITTCGSITDSLELASRQVGVSCCNISCGYYSPHTLAETVSIKDVFNTLNFTTELITHLGQTKYEHKYETYVYTQPTGYNTGHWRECKKCLSWKQGTIWLQGVGDMCSDCLKKHNSKQLPTYSNKPLDPNNLCTTCTHFGKYWGECYAPVNFNCPKEKKPKNSIKDSCEKIDCLKCVFSFTCTLPKRLKLREEEKNNQDPCINCSHVRGFADECTTCTKVKKKPNLYDTGTGIPTCCQNCDFYGDREEQCLLCPQKVAKDNFRVLQNTPKENKLCPEQTSIVKRIDNCEQCKAEQLWQPEWCCDCVPKVETPSPEGLE